MLNDAQYQQLLKPLNPSRIAKRSGGGKSLSYLEAWDVKAHLTRIFGFGEWSWEVTKADLAFEEQNERGGWHVGYRVIGSLRINSLWASYTEAAVGFATLPSRGEAHDMAVKTAESDALKRAAINLGDQFGLSLYNDGSTKPVVGHTLDRDTVSQATDTPEMAPEAPSEAPADNEGSQLWIDQMKAAIDAKDIPALLEIKRGINDTGAADWLYQGTTLAKWMDRAVVAAGKGEQS